MQQSYTHTYSLTAGECNAQGVMPVTLLTSRLIEVATEHANGLGIGYAGLQPRGIVWVLSRVSINMLSWPGINSTYSVTTWIEGWTRFYSDRCFMISDGDGNVIGYARTVWVAIDIKKRTVAQLDDIADEAMVNTALQCAVPKQRKMPPVVLDEATQQKEYTFQYADLDFNRHVNSVRYIEHILNLWPLDFFDKHSLDVFEIAYVHECLFGQTVTFVTKEAEDQDGNQIAAVDILRDGERVITARLAFSERNKLQTT